MIIGTYACHPRDMKVNRELTDVIVGKVRLTQGLPEVVDTVRAGLRSRELL